jgi:hypothetical protein
MKSFFYSLFIIDVIIGIILSMFVNIIVGTITACVLLFINIVTFVVILKIEKKKKEFNSIYK